MLERFKLRAPPLPLKLEALWPQIRNNHARQVSKYHNAYVGCFIVQEVNRVISELGKHFTHPDPKVYHCKDEGNPRAFEDFVQQMRTK